MASNKPKELLIEYELKFLEKKLKELKAYIADTPFSTLDDRSIVGSSTMNKNGEEVLTYKIVATKEAQRKDLTQALKDYAEIVRTVDAMRVAEEGKVPAVRGDEKLGAMAASFLANRDKK